MDENKAYQVKRRVDELKLEGPLFNKEEVKLSIAII